jgi:KaiC/GvpD/RAD55 family RecA-like ATPase
MTLEELLNRKFPKREYLLDPVLKQGESMLLWAAPGVGKTMLSMSMAIAVAGGGELLGFKGAGGKRVLIIDGEMNAHDLQERFVGLLSTVKGTNVEDAKRNITLGARHAQKLSVRFPDLAYEEGQEEVINLALLGKYDLVILDNFSTLALGLEDENAASAISPIVGFLMRLKQARVACILVHHSGKGGNSYRGSSKIATTFEVIWALTKPEGGPSHTQRADFELGYEKFRGKQSAETMGKRCWLDDSTGQLEWKYELSESEEMEKFLNLVKSGQFNNQGQIAKVMNTNDTRITRLKNRAFAERRIARQEFNEYLNLAKKLGFTTADDEPEGNF